MDQRKLQERLRKIWARPDFNLIFEKEFKKTPRPFKKGTIIFNEGDQTGRLFFIKEGFVKLFRVSNDGKETTIYLYGPGNMLGIRALTTQAETHWHTAQALTDLKIVTILKDEYLNVLSKNPEYIVDLLHIFISRLNYTERRLEGFITTDATARVAMFLSDVARRFERELFKTSPKTNQPITLPLKLTHQQVAEFVGALRETVTVCMNKLEKMDIIKDEKGKITILDLKRLNSFEF